MYVTHITHPVCDWMVVMMLMIMLVEQYCFCATKG